MRTVPAFEITHLGKTYGHGSAAVEALRGVDLIVERGEFLVLLGPSGSGKSTLLNILGGLDYPSYGTVAFDGRSLGDRSAAALSAYRREHVSFVFQFYNLLPGLTAYENVELVCEIADDPMPADEALALVDLSARRDHFPSQLSGGEQQRVAIARAIAKQPRVLLCDEPTGALDRQTGIGVLGALVAVNERLNTTVLVVTHNAGVADIGDRVVRFQDGRVAAITRNPTRRSPTEVTW